ncbi:MAG: biotin/lipoyl-containing protein [Chloroflexota bacterium]
MHFHYEWNGVISQMTLERQGEGFRALIDGVPYAVEVLNRQPGELSLRIDGRPLRLYWAVDGEQRWVSLGGCTFRLAKPAGRGSRHGETPGEASVRSPMPAQVRAVLVAAGDVVEKGQALLVLEAMKMEIRLAAPHAGIVGRVLAVEGEQVARDQALVELKAQEG